MTIKVKVAVWVELEAPDVVEETLAFATTVTTFVPSGVPVCPPLPPVPLPPAPLPPAHPRAPLTKMAPTSSRSSMPPMRTVNDRRRHAMKLPSNRPGRKKTAASVGPCVVLFWAMVAVPLAVVVMVNVEVCTVFDPLAVTLSGAKVHVAPTGRPEQEKPTVPTNPPYGVKVKDVVAGCPATTVTLDGFTLSVYPGLVFPEIMMMLHEVPVAPLASVTIIEKVPLAVGVPVISPVEVVSDRPAGSVPTIE